MNGDRRVVRIGSFIGLDRGVIGELFGFRQVIPPESGSGSGLSSSGIVQLFGMAAGSPGTAAGIGISLARQPSCVNNCSEEEALLPGRIGVLPGCQTCAGTIVRKPSPAAPGVPAAPEQLFGQVAWRLRKKKSRKTKTCSFYFLQLNKGLFKCLIIYYIVTVANPVK